MKVGELTKAERLEAKVRRLVEQIEGRAVSVEASVGNERLPRFGVEFQEPRAQVKLAWDWWSHRFAAAAERGTSRAVAVKENFLRQERTWCEKESGAADKEWLVVLIVCPVSRVWEQEKQKQRWTLANHRPRAGSICIHLIFPLPAFEIHLFLRRVSIIQHWLQLPVDLPLPNTVVLMGGGPYLMYKITPTEEELRKRYNPELRARSEANRDEKAREADEFVAKLKEYSKSDKPIWTVWKEDALRQKRAAQKAEEDQKLQRSSIKEELRRQRLEEG
ncbi:MAG: hypothetical protein Q9162_004999 [Coniocarpon cinnabarinum]